MSSRIELSLSPSPAAGVLSSLPWLALAAFTAVAALDTSLWLLPLLVPEAILAFRQFRRCGLLQGPGAVVGLHADADNLTCQLADGQSRAVKVCGASSLGANILALKLRQSDTRSGSMFVLILGNSALYSANAPEAGFRRLRMWLRAGQPVKAP